MDVDKAKVALNAREIATEAAGKTLKMVGIAIELRNDVALAKALEKVATTIIRIVADDYESEI